MILSLQPMSAEFMKSFANEFEVPRWMDRVEAPFRNFLVRGGTVQVTLDSLGGEPVINLDRYDELIHGWNECPATAPVVSAQLRSLARPLMASDLRSYTACRVPEPGLQLDMLLPNGVRRYHIYDDAYNPDTVQRIQLDTGAAIEPVVLAKERQLYVRRTVRRALYAAQRTMAFATV